ncbi:MAG TPA: iron ABC transporter permease [Longimicrobiales bacterium]|nr:iron ABC transporter permease [Longimicrobiales bacterium]
MLFTLLFVFVAYPLVRVLGASVLREGAFTLDVYREMLTRRGAGVPLLNSLRLAATVAVTGTLVGFATAYMITMVAVPGRRVARFIAMLPMLAPPFMIALAAIMLLGRNGIVTGAVIDPLFGRGSFEIYGFGGLVLVQTLTFFPLSMLLLVGTLSSLDPSLEEAAQSQGAPPWRVFRDVVLPLAVPGILSSMLLLFIESLADFGNPLILGGDFRVLSVAAFLRITGEFDTAGGAVLAMLLLVPALSAFLVQRHYAARTTFATITGKPTLRRTVSSARMKFAAAAVLASVCVTVLAFYAVVAYGSVVRVWGIEGTFTLANYTGALRQAGDALGDSLLLAAIATPVAGAIGMAAAWLLVRRTFRGRSLLATLALLTFALPGTVVGIGYILAFNAPPLQLTGTAAIIVALFVFRGVPVALEAGRTGIQQVDPSIEESSASLGATPGATWRRVVLPLAAPAVFTGLAHAFVRSITAISAVIFVVSGKWNLVTVSILGFVENADLARAAALCIILVAILAVVLGAVQAAVSRMAVRA